MNKQKESRETYIQVVKLIYKRIGCCKDDSLDYDQVTPKVITEIAK